MKGSSTGLLVAVATGACWLAIRARTKKTATHHEKAGELSAMQTWFVHAQDKGNDQIISCVVLEGSLGIFQLEQAVEKMQSRDATLGAALMVSSDGSFRLEHNNETRKLSGTVDLVENQDWKDVADSCINSVHFPKPTEAKPYTATWKVVLVKNSQETVLIFILNHVCFDGTSRNRLIRAFLEALVDHSSTEHPTIPVFSGRQAMGKVKYMSWARFTVNCTRLLWQELQCRGCYWTMPLSTAPGIQDPNIGKATKQILVQLSPTETTALIQRCKIERTTVHGALSAAGSLALVALGRDQHYEIPNPVVGSSHLISLWKQADMPEDALAGALISTQSAHVHAACRDPWKVAKDIKAQLQNFAPMGMPQFLISMKLRQMIRKPLATEYATLLRTPTICFSNNGQS